MTVSSDVNDSVCHQVGVAQEGGGANVVDFQPGEGTSAVLSDTLRLTDGHSYVVLLKVRGLFVYRLLNV